MSIPPNKKTDEWIDSLAGLFLLIPGELLPAWHGIEETESETQVDFRCDGPDCPPSDYDRACDVQGDMAIIDVADGYALILCSEYDHQAALHQVSKDQAIVVQLLFESGRSSSWKSISREAFGPPEFYIDLRSGSLVLSNPGNSGENLADGIGEPIQEVNLTPGRYSLSTLDFDGPPDAIIVVHWLQREGDVGQITPAESKVRQHTLATATAKTDEPLFRVFVNGKTGFINQEGELVIAPHFHKAGDFSEGLAPVLVEGNYGYINHLGEIAIEPQFELADTFCNGLGRVKSSGELVVYIDRTGRPLLAGDDAPQSVSAVRERMIVDRKWGYADGQGNIVIPCEFGSATSFIDGLAQVSRGKKSWFIDMQGAIQFEVDRRMDMHSFSEGLCPFTFYRRKKPSGGYIDKSGEIVLGPNAEWLFPGKFSEGFAWVLDTNERYRYIDRSGTVVVSGFRAKNDFAEGLAAVAVDNGRFGFIDQTGSFVIPPQYSAAWRFRDGLAMVRRNGRWIYIDHNSNVVWPKSHYHRCDVQVSIR